MITSKTTIPTIGSEQIDSRYRKWEWYLALALFSGRLSDDLLLIRNDSFFTIIILFTQIDLAVCKS